MFTGIVQDVGTVQEVAPGGLGNVRLRVAAPAALRDARVGDSIAVCGVCLTVTALGPDGGWFEADVVPETLSRTTLGGLRTGDAVNLEPCLRPVDRLGGHIVQGHVDAVGRVRDVAREGDGVRMTIEAPPSVLRYVVEKGSIAVDGVSLTVAGLRPGAFEVALIPHTLRATTLGRRRPGDAVNLEADILGKYVERLLQGRAGDGPFAGGERT